MIIRHLRTLLVQKAQKNYNLLTIIQLVMNEDKRVVHMMTLHHSEIQ